MKRNVIFCFCFLNKFKNGEFLNTVESLFQIIQYINISIDLTAYFCLI